MANKYAHHIVTEFKKGLALPEFRGGANFDGSSTSRSHFMMYLGQEVVKGSPYLEAVWLWPGAADPKGGFPQHVHEHDESIGFFGSDTGNVYDLGGEIEFWIEDEQYLLTKSCLIFIPGGLRHCPIKFLRIDRPIFHFLMVTGGSYT